MGDLAKRGSAARYRRAVEMQIAKWVGAMWAHATIAAKAGADNGLSAPASQRYARAISRARAILERLGER
jgi:hypothetical protein